MNIEITNWPGLPWKGHQEGVKRTRRDEPIRLVTHVYMESAQGNSLCSYLYLKLAKTLCFSFYFLCFFFYKIREQEDGTMEQVLGERVGTGGSGEKVRKGKDEYSADNVYTCM
jgi:hypothetical protein